MMQPDFSPVYKVKCYAGNVEYKLRIDAVTGTVLSSKADVDDDIFSAYMMQAAIRAGRCLFICRKNAVYGICRWEGNWHK